MSTTECRECNKQVAHMANVCPHCGAKDPAITEGARTVYYLLAGAFMLWLWFYGLDMILE